jgi:hypothetical protein
MASAGVEGAVCGGAADHLILPAERQGSLSHLIARRPRRNLRAIGQGGVTA